MTDNTTSRQISSSRLDTILRRPLYVGIAIGILAAVVQLLLISAGGPESYGFCVACHTRDLVNGGINAVAGTTLGLAPLSKNAILPVLTIIGVLVGSFAAARYYQEFKMKSAGIGSYLCALIGGILFMIFALFMGGCPYRIGLRVGYGDVVAFIGLLAIIIGVFIGIKVATALAEREG